MWYGVDGGRQMDSLVREKVAVRLWWIGVCRSDEDDGGGLLFVVGVRTVMVVFVWFWGLGLDGLMDLWVSGRGERRTLMDGRTDGGARAASVPMCRLNWAQ